MCFFFVLCVIFFTKSLDRTKLKQFGILCWLKDPVFQVVGKRCHVLTLHSGVCGLFHVHAKIYSLNCRNRNVMDNQLKIVVFTIEYQTAEQNLCLCVVFFQFVSFFLFLFPHLLLLYFLHYCSPSSFLFFSLFLDFRHFSLPINFPFFQNGILWQPKLMEIDKHFDQYQEWCYFALQIKTINTSNNSKWLFLSGIFVSRLKFVISNIFQELM